MSAAECSKAAAGFVVHTNNLLTEDQLNKGTKP